MEERPEKENRPTYYRGASVNLLYPYQLLRYRLASWLLLHFPQAARLIPGAYTLIVDFWEGNIDLNPDALWAGGVRGVILRLNSITGGHHRDDLFDRYWALFARFIRFPYFVYNPFTTAQANFDWLKANLPAGARRVAIDIEVKRDGYSPAAYAADVQQFISLVKAAGLIPVIYTGAWFLPLLAYWPKDIEYWWARYPYALYPPSSLNISWEELFAKLDALGWLPAEAGVIPGPCLLWQCSGDRFKLPGTGGRVIDICVANMPVTQYQAWVGEELPAPKGWAVSMTEWARPLGYAGPDPERA